MCPANLKRKNKKSAGICMVLNTTGEEKKDKKSERKSKN